MKKNIRYIACLLGMAAGMMSCSDADEKAQARYNRAEQLMNEMRFSEAKLQLDSVRILYPKSYDVIKNGLQLMRTIEMREAERIIVYSDSLLNVLQTQVDPLTKNFVFEKDTAYQKVGFYIHKLQQVERNVERNYLRTQVDETGKLQIASVYFGRKPIEHSAMRLDTKDGAFAQTEEIPYDGGTNYRFTDNGNQTEVVTYTDGRDGGVVDLICLYPKERIKVTYKGKSPYVYYLDDQNKKAIVETVDLAKVLSEITGLKQNKAIAEKKIELLKKRIEQKAQAVEK
ncbi:MAG: hypothetical protein IJ338_04680 [Bacteroidaceae bacterium]|nr:hypothetical protein [Bacteroidaceae bacterium]